MTEESAVYNLLLDLDELAPLLRSAYERGDWLDSFLLAAGIAQIVEDGLHPEIYPLDRAAGLLDDGHATTAHALKLTADVARAAASKLPAAGAAIRWHARLARLVSDLADAVTGDDRGRLHESRVDDVLSGASALARRDRRALVRTPGCFQGFDQDPQDVRALVMKFATGRPMHRARPLLVVGVRTSGSYLAPLAASYLRSAGFRSVATMTTRPGRRLLAHEQRLVRATADDGGLALLLDDPPVTGASLARSASLLEQGGLGTQSIIPLLAVYDAADLPPALAGYPAVVLAWPKWAVRARLSPEAVADAMTGMLGVAPRHVVPLTPDPPKPVRGHVRAVFQVNDLQVAVEGVGLGYLGRRTADVMSAVGNYAPRVFGLERGLLYREWLPDATRVGGAPGPELTAGIAGYVARRRTAMPLAEDPSLRLAGETPAWEVASEALSHAFGRAWPVVKVLAMDRAVKRIVRVQRPAVVDGDTGLAQWFADETRSVVKANPGGSIFSTRGVVCFDPAFDLAGVTAGAPDVELGQELRRAYEATGGEAVDAERLMLYELTHLWALGRNGPGHRAALDRARTRTLQRYFAELYLADVTPRPDGPLCALDLDGVLETQQLGFPALTPVAALGLRALIAHGYRPVLATGRSLGEVAERCRAYGLPGGVAEYGSGVHEAGGGASTSLLPAAGSDALAQLRSRLAALDGVQLDGDYELAVRAYTVGGDGRHGPVSHPSALLASLPPGLTGIRAIEGDAQTDFVLQGIDKGTGMRELVSRLGADNGGNRRMLELAVGDTISDAPLAALAERAYAPAHADRALAQHGYELTTRSYQAGFAEAVGRLLGHRPGACELCRMPPASRERRLVLTALAAHQCGVRGAPRKALELVLLTR
ncbi:MAG: hypothetical protein M3065_03790 [Actinomycetota bacterium]|nr:hypothetical protein [Actinomycetota bacterium]